MSKPKNPDTTLFKNEFYPKGLKEIDVWQHYQDNKRLILNEIDGRNVVLFLIVEGGKIVVKRSGPIRLNDSNYDKIISGRTITILSTVKSVDNISLIDVDCSDFGLAKKITLNTYDLVSKSSLVKPLRIDNIEIRYTGKDSFHIFLKLGKSLNIDVIRSVLMGFFKNTRGYLSGDFNVSKSRAKSTSKPNIDLYRNVKNGAFICLHSLSIKGLECVKLGRIEVVDFEKKFSRIRSI